MKLATFRHRGVERTGRVLEHEHVIHAAAPGISMLDHELRQNGCAGQTMHDVPELIATLSAGIELIPGDIIATGTPAGVGIGYDPPRFLRDGDEVTICVDGLGRLSNVFRARRGAGSHNRNAS